MGLEPVFPRTQDKPPGLACFSDPATILAVSLQRIEFFALSHAVRWISEACRTVWCRRRISPSQACRHARPGMRIGECPLPCQATRKRRKSIMISHFCKSLGAKQICGSFRYIKMAIDSRLTDLSATGCCKRDSIPGTAQPYRRERPSLTLLSATGRNPAHILRNKYEWLPNGILVLVLYDHDVICVATSNRVMPYPTLS